MNTNGTIVIFGGSDPEAMEARRVATATGLATGTATLGGKQVVPATAYRADGFVVDGGQSAEGLTDAIIFECNPAVAGALKVVAKCDHHNPGDFGFGRGPEQFFEASSLGQLMNLLGLKPTEKQLLYAASDHCVGAGYRGLCPGISPEALFAHRISEKVAFYATQPKFTTKATPEALEKVIASATEKLQSAPVVEGGVRDLRAAGMVDELPEAALRSGEAYMASLPDTDREQKPTGNTKIVLGGHTIPEVVTAFLAWANALPNKVGDAYGNPTRGFAGVVVDPNKCPHDGYELLPGDGLRECTVCGRLS